MGAALVVTEGRPKEMTFLQKGTVGQCLYAGKAQIRLGEQPARDR